MGASAALADWPGCTKQPDEPIYPYVKQPERFGFWQAELLCHGASVRHWKRCLCWSRAISTGPSRSTAIPSTHITRRRRTRLRRAAAGLI